MSLLQDRDTFDVSVYEVWDTALSDGSRFELRPNGINIPVTYDERLEWIEAVEQWYVSKGWG